MHSNEGETNVGTLLVILWLVLVCLLHLVGLLSLFYYRVCVCVFIPIGP